MASLGQDEFICRRRVHVISSAGIYDPYITLNVPMSLTSRERCLFTYSTLIPMGVIQ